MKTMTTIPYENISSRRQSEQLFTKCCFCFPLRTGCMVLAYLSFISALLQTLYTIGLTVTLGIESEGFTNFDDYTVSRNSEVAARKLFWYFAVVLTVNFIWLAISLACVIGLHKRKPGPIRFYCTFASVRLFILIATIIFMVGASNFSLDMLTGRIFDTMFSAYFLLVYYVYVHQLEKEVAAENRQNAYINNVMLSYPTDQKIKTIA